MNFSSVRSYCEVSWLVLSLQPDDGAVSCNRSQPLHIHVSDNITSVAIILYTVPCLQGCHCSSILKTEGNGRQK